MPVCVYSCARGVSYLLPYLLLYLPSEWRDLVQTYVCSEELERERGRSFIGRISALPSLSRTYELLHIHIDASIVQFFCTAQRVFFFCDMTVAKIIIFLGGGG